MAGKARRAADVSHLLSSAYVPDDWYRGNIVCVSCTIIMNTREESESSPCVNEVPCDLNMNPNLNLILVHDSSFCTSVCQFKFLFVLHFFSELGPGLGEREAA